MTEQQRKDILINLKYAEELCQEIIGIGMYGDTRKHMKDLEDLLYMVSSQVSTATNSNIRLNQDTEHVEKIRKALQKTGGYCPCKLQKTDDTFCMCKEFRDQIADEDFYGKCHCGLYEKVKVGIEA